MNRLQLERIITAHGDSIYSFCRHLTGNTQEAEDLYQDTFLKAIELDRIDFSINPKSYLLGIRVNLWKNKTRKYFLRQKKVNTLPLQPENDWEYADGGRSPEDTARQAEIRETVHKAVAGLDDKYRIIVLLYYMEEMTVSQIARMLKMPQGTVKSRLYKARKILKNQLEDLL